MDIAHLFTDGEKSLCFTFKSCVKGIKVYQLIRATSHLQSTQVLVMLTSSPPVLSFCILFHRNALIKSGEKQFICRWCLANIITYI